LRPPKKKKGGYNKESGRPFSFERVPEKKNNKGGVPPGFGGRGASKARKKEERANFSKRGAGGERV